MFKRLVVIWSVAAIAVAGAFGFGYLLGGSTHSVHLRAMSSSNPSDSAATPEQGTDTSALGEFDPNYKIDPKYPLARSSQELPLVQMAVKTCNQINKVGASGTVTTSDLVEHKFFVAPQSLIKGKVGAYQGYIWDKGGYTAMFMPLTVCEIADKNATIIRFPNTAAAVSMEHIINVMTFNGIIGWNWHSHTQSVELSNIYLESSDGKLIDSESNNQGTLSQYKYTFGLTAAQLAEARQVIASSN